MSPTSHCTFSVRLITRSRSESQDCPPLAHHPKRPGEPRRNFLFTRAGQHSILRAVLEGVMKTLLLLAAVCASVVSVSASTVDITEMNVSYSPPHRSGG